QVQVADEVHKLLDVCITFPIGQCEAAPAAGQHHVRVRVRLPPATHAPNQVFQTFHRVQKTKEHDEWRGWWQAPALSRTGCQLWVATSWDRDVGAHRYDLRIEAN